jgi:hypothetical protein
MEGQVLSFELTNEGRAIQISCDRDGMMTLITALEKIRASGDHVHLLTPANGGRELSEKSPFGKDTVGEVILDWIETR